MYDGEDRVQQCNALRQLASDLASGLVGEGTPTELVTYWEANTEDKPAWYDEHDRRLLIEWTEKALSQ